MVYMLNYISGSLIIWVIVAVYHILSKNIDGIKYYRIWQIVGKSTKASPPYL